MVHRGSSRLATLEEAFGRPDQVGAKERVEVGHVTPEACVELLHRPTHLGKLARQLGHEPFGRRGDVDAMAWQDHLVERLGGGDCLRRTTWRERQLCRDTPERRGLDEPERFRGARERDALVHVRVRRIGVADPRHAKPAASEQSPGHERSERSSNDNHVVEALRLDHGALPLGTGGDETANSALAPSMRTWRPLRCTRPSLSH